MQTVIDRLLKPLEPLPTAIEPILNRIGGVRALLFDVYGTLLISDSGDVGSAMSEDRPSPLKATLDAVGIDPARYKLSDLTYHDLIARIKKRQAAARIQGIVSPEIDVRDVWAEVLTDLGLVDEAQSRDLVERIGMGYECRANTVWPMPNWDACLRQLRRMNLKLGIVSNAQFYTPLILERLLPGFPADLGFDPELIVYSYEILQSKPGKTIFEQPLSALKRRHGITSDETVYVGNDMLNDVWTADQLGMRTILFAGDRRSLRLREDDPRCQTVEPDAVVKDLRQIPALLT